ncbi:MAG: CBS domain-containing protein [Pseudomonadota bacterium]
MRLFGDLFVSEILKKPVLDLKGEDLGRIKDVAVVKWEPFPKVDGLVLQRRGRSFKLPWSQVSIFNKKVIAAKLSENDLLPYASSEEDLLAVRDLFDKQIVDANGAKVVRVNDIKLEDYMGNAILVAVDVGTRGILRRLGIEKGGEGLLRLFKTELRQNLISWQYIQPLHDKLSHIALTVPRQLLAELHPADLAELITHISHDEGAAFINSLDVGMAADTIIELEPGTQTAIMEDMDPERASDIIEEMPPDDATDIVSRLSAEKAKVILEGMHREEAEDIHELLSHEHNTAGGLMTNEFIAYPSAMTSTEVIERFRHDAREMGRIYYVFVVDDERLVGALSLRQLLLAPPEETLFATMETNLKTVHPEDNKQEVAETMFKYNLVAVPVIDEEGQMLGLVTIDDVGDMLLGSRSRRRRRG